MFELLLIVVLFVFAIFMIKSGIKAFKAKPEDLKFDLNIYFIDGYNNYNPVKIQKGKCKFKVESGKLYFEQNGNIVEDNIFDIYNIRTWTFKGVNYLAIRMKTSSEYKFTLYMENKDDLKTATFLTQAFLNIFKNFCKKLKIDFVDCGESQPKDDEEEYDNEDI